MSEFQKIEYITTGYKEIILLLQPPGCSITIIHVQGMDTNEMFEENYNIIIKYMKKLSFKIILFSKYVPIRCMHQIAACVFLLSN